MMGTMAEVTCYSDTWMQRIVGHNDWNIDLAGFYDASSASGFSSSLNALLAASVLIGIFPNKPNEGEIGYEGVPIETDYTISGPVDGPIAVNMTYSGSARLSRTKVISSCTSYTTVTTANGTATDMGATASRGTFVLRLPSGSATVWGTENAASMAIQSASSTTSAEFVTYTNFTPFAGVTSEILNYSGSVDRYVRCQWNLTGATAPNLDWIVTAETYGTRKLWQGLSWNESTDAYTRRGSLAAFAAGATPGNATLPIQSVMRRCVISDAGVVQYYLNATDSTLKANGDPSDLTGADGQVMVEIPKFYYKYSWVSNVHTWDISRYELTGFVVHPAFVKNGVEVDFRYVGAYEGVLYDDSKSVYTSDYNPVASHSATFDVDNGASKGTITAGAGTPYALLQAGDVIVVSGTADNDGTYIIDSIAGDNVITTTAVITGADGVEATTVISAPAVDTSNDILSSVSGKKAFTGITRANFRLIAAKRGTGWRQFDFYLASAIQLLYLVEYADFYSQSTIGLGLTDWVAATWTAYNAQHAINNSGLSNGDGDAVNNVSGGDGVVGSYMTYRGIENWFGHTWQFIDGFNINNNIPYFSNTDTDFADDTATNYDVPGITLHNADGYQGALEQIDEGFLPADVTGTSTTKITDYYNQAAGWKVALLGGAARYSGYAGGFNWYMHYASSGLLSYFSARLAY